MTVLLNLDDIAARWQVSRDYARRYLTRLPAFPEKAPGSTYKNPRWIPSEVEEYQTRPAESPG